MEYRATLASAQEFSRAGRLEEWVLAYLSSEDGNNLPFAEGLRMEPRVYLGPFPIPLDQLERNSGPEPDIQFPANPKDFENRVLAMADFLREGGELPPVIVNVTGGRLVVNDGNHRAVAYQKLGLETCQVILWATAGPDAEAMLEFVPD